MNKKILEIIKIAGGGHFLRTYSTFADDKYITWSSRSGRGSITKNQIHSAGFGYTGSPDIGDWYATSSIKGLRKAKSIHFTFNANWWTDRGWYVRIQPDGWMKLLGDYIFIRAGGNGSYLQVGGHTLLSIGGTVTYDLTFYQKYLICNDTRYDYPEGVKLSKAATETIEGHAYSGFITSNDYFVTHYFLTIGDIEVEHRV